MKTDEELCGALQEATGGLLMMSESDYPFEVIKWDGSVQLSPERLSGAAGGEDSPAKIEESDLAEFFRVPAGEQEWKDEAGLQAARKFQRLRQLLEDNLTGLKAYRVGEINIYVLLVGLSAEGNWMGVSTRVVET